MSRSGHSDLHINTAGLRMFDVFELTLMVNHACNLRCAYCYTGAKIPRPISNTTSLTAIARALYSLRKGRELHPGFFGGEPLLEADVAKASLRLPGNIFTGIDFLDSGFTESAPEGRSAEGCDSCAIRSSCSTFCRCSNFIRTGNVSEPDGLLCLLDRLCFRETNRVLQSRVFEVDVPPPADISFRAEGAGHVIGQPP